MIIRPHVLVIASLLAAGLVRAEPAKGSAAKPAPAPAPKDPGISISIHDGKVDIGGIDKLVDEQLKNAFDSIDHGGMPPAVRDELKDRLGKLRGTIGARLGHLNAKDLDQLGEELDKLGEDIDQQMQGFGSDMDKWGKKFGKDWAKKLNKQIGRHGVHVQVDDDDDLSAVDLDDDDDLDDAIRDLGDLQLQPPQKDAIAKIRTDSDKQAAAAKQALEAASKTLHDQLESGKASDADIAKSIDAVAQQEAAVRKARILAWVSARRVLDDAQRKRVEAAAKGKTK